MIVHREIWEIIFWFAIKVIHKIFKIHLYEKGDDFLSSIVRTPHPTSNIAPEMFYSAFGAETLRATYTTNKYETSCKISENLITRTTKQGSDI